MKIYELRVCGVGYKYTTYYVDKDRAKADGEKCYGYYVIALDGRKTRWIKKCGNGWLWSEVKYNNGREV